jgi:hypothetical protein
MELAEHIKNALGSQSPRAMARKHRMQHRHEVQSSGPRIAAIARRPVIDSSQDTCLTAAGCFIPQKGGEV